ncbi:hypothetical protein [Georgenia alba]|uniref:DUF3710 domain-containing protein n=1 Tax=Georgenia alba TaxID=2233858 RepID=A0ABW2Q717_9MICO
MDEEPAEAPSETGAAEAAEPAPAAGACALLSAAEVEQLLGGPGSVPTPGQSAGVPNCRWSGADGRTLQTIAGGATEWARGLPELVRAIEASGAVDLDAEEVEALRRGVEMVEAGQDIEAGAACDLFSEMLRVQGEEPGTQRVVALYPNADAPLAVSGQACTDGRFTSVVLLDEGGWEEPPPLELVDAALGSAHRASLR